MLLAFIRTLALEPRRLKDLAFIGDPASVRTLVSNLLRLVLLFVPDVC